MKKLFFALLIFFIGSSAFCQTQRGESTQTFKPSKRSGKVFIPETDTKQTYNTYKLVITNDAGVVVFESTDPQAGWDGTYEGKIVANGEYKWTITFTETGSTERHSHYGHVTVLK